MCIFVSSFPITTMCGYGYIFEGVHVHKNMLNENVLANIQMCFWIFYVCRFYFLFTLRVFFRAVCLEKIKIKKKPMTNDKYEILDGYIITCG